MKRIFPALVVLVPMLTLIGHAVEPVTGPTETRFKYELHTAQSGALLRAVGGNDHANDLVHSVFVDSKGAVYVGTQNGLAIYDGKTWSNRTFKIKISSVVERAIFALFDISKCGPEQIAEGPAGTIWLGGSGCGIWRLRDGNYEEIGSSPEGSYLGMAVDKDGSLWVLTRESVHKYDGAVWTEALSPYIAGSVHYELPELCSMVVDANGSIWIGGTVYGKPDAPWEHGGAVWVVDHKRKQRGNGPPMAGLYEFNGKGWRAFGTASGLETQERETLLPELDGKGRLMVKTLKGYYVRDGETWTLLKAPGDYGGKKWVLRERDAGFLTGYYAEMFFRDGERLVPVQPNDQKTGEGFDLGTQQRSVLRMAEDRNRNCVWLGTMQGLYRIWPETRAGR